MSSSNSGSRPREDYYVSRLDEGPDELPDKCESVGSPCITGMSKSRSSVLHRNLENTHLAVRLFRPDDIRQEELRHRTIPSRQLGAGMELLRGRNVLLPTDCRCGNSLSGTDLSGVRNCHTPYAPFQRHKMASETGFCVRPRAMRSGFLHKGRERKPATLLVM